MIMLSSGFGRSPGGTAKSKHQANAHLVFRRCHDYEMGRMPHRDDKEFGYFAILRTAVPLAMTVGCFAITLFTDRTLLMRFDPTASAASMAAGNLYWAIVCIPVTAVGFVTPLIANEMGGPRQRGQSVARTWSLVWQTVWLTVGSLPVLALVAVLAPRVFAAFGHTAELAQAESQYLRVLLLVAPASMLEAGLTGFFVGRRITAPILKANIAAAVINVVLDGWFIFGGLGLPPGGVLGAASATAVALWTKVSLFAIVLVRLRSFRRTWRNAIQPDLKQMRRIMLPGSTLGLGQLIRSTLFSLVLLWIGAGSVTGLAATTATLSIYQLLSIPAIGLATAVTVVVGQAMARVQNEVAAKTIRRSLMIGAASALFVAIVLAVLPGPLLRGVLGQIDSQEKTDVFQTATVLMYFAAIYAVTDIMSLVCSAIIKAMGRTSVILIATAVPGVVVFALAYGVAPSGEGTTLHWWLSLLAWSACQVTVLTLAIRPSRFAGNSYLST